MSVVMAKAAGTEALKLARKALRKNLKRGDWSLHGRIRSRPMGTPGWWIVTTPENDPLRLCHEPTGQWIVVPFRRMQSDFASIPKLAQKIGAKVESLHLDPRDYELAAFFHDEVYAAAWVWVVFAGKAVKVPVSKREADAILLVCLCCLGATVADGLAYHGAVSLFGGTSWSRCRAEPAPWPVLWGGREKAKKGKSPKDGDGGKENEK